MAGENDTRDVETLTQGYCSEKGRVMLDIRGDDLLDIFGIDAV